MAKLYKLKSGYYYIYFQQADGTENKLSTKTKKKVEAQKFFENFITQKSLPSKPIVGEIINCDDITLKDYTEKFLSYSRAFHSYKTTNDYITTFKYFMQSVSSTTPISKITLRDANQFIEKRIIKSLYGARRDVINLKAMFNKAVSDGYLDKNPCTKLKRIKVPEKQPLFFTRNEFNKLLSVVDEKDFYDLIVFAVFTGCRQMEIIELTWSQIDLVSNIVLLNNHSHITKSKKVRSIPLNPTLIELIKKRHKQCNNELVFTFNGDKIKQDYLQDRFKKYIVNAGLNNKLHFHSLRHTFASWLVQNGTSIYCVSKLLGHSDVRTTEIYSHLQSEDLRKSIDNLRY